MTKTTIDTIRALLESVLTDADDSEATFKLRTALQLLVVIEEQQAGTRRRLAEVDVDEGLREDLRRLGYLD